MKNFLLVISIICFSPFSFAQNSGENGVIYTFDPDFEHQYFYNLNQSGGLVRSNSKEKVNKSTIVKFEFLDTNLAVYKSFEYKVGENLFSHKHFYDEKVWLQLFINRGYKFEVLSYDILNHTYKTFKGKLPVNCTVEEIIYSNDYAYILYREGRGHFQLLSINMNSGSSDNFIVEVEGPPATYVSGGYLFCAGSDKGVLLQLSHLSKEYDWFYLISNDKAPVKLKIPEIINGNNILEVQEVYSSETSNDIFLTGTYTSGKSRNPEGVYVLNINSSGLNWSSFHRFSNLKGFFDYLNPKDKDKIKSKLAKAKKSGKDYTVALDYDCTVSRIYRNGDHLYLLVQLDKDLIKGQYLIGNDYKSFTLIQLDLNGNVDWSNNFEMNQISNPYSSHLLVQVEQLKSSTISLSYINEDAKNFVQIDAQGVVGDSEKGPARKTDFEGRSGRIDIEYFMPWYTDTYIGKGKLEIQNKDGRNINVFYFYKI